MNSPNSRFVIAIDGPSGAGKSTVAHLLSQRLGVPLLDTGAMYRCLALAAMSQGWPSQPIETVLPTISAAKIDFTGAGRQVVTLNGEDVSQKIRSLEVSQAASKLSTVSEIRRQLVAQQQAIIASGSWVLEGRDVTTVVAPDANLKVFLTASIEERARRRWKEYQAKGGQETLQTVVKEVVERDFRDYTRDDSPLQLAEDAVIVESFGLTPEEVADRILSLLPDLPGVVN